MDALIATLVSLFSKYCSESIACVGSSCLRNIIARFKSNSDANDWCLEFLMASTHQLYPSSNESSIAGAIRFAVIRMAFLVNCCCFCSHCWSSSDRIVSKIYSCVALGCPWKFTREFIAQIPSLVIVPYDRVSSRWFGKFTWFHSNCRGILLPMEGPSRRYNYINLNGCSLSDKSQKQAEWVLLYRYKINSSDLFGNWFGKGMPIK